MLLEHNQSFLKNAPKHTQYKNLQTIERGIDIKQGKKIVNWLSYSFYMPFYLVNMVDEFINE